MLAASVAAQAARLGGDQRSGLPDPDAAATTAGSRLAQAGTLAAMPIAGVMVTLFLWGLVVDRVGERTVLAHRPRGGDGAPRRPRHHGARHRSPLGAALFAVGMFAASTELGQRAHRGRLVPAASAAAWPWASGRWPSRSASPSRRPPSRWSPSGPACAAALWVPVVATGAGLASSCSRSCSTRPARRATAALTANPYRADGFLARVHGVSVLLVVPQFLVWTYSLTWLVQERDWSRRRRRRPGRGHPRARRPRPDRGRPALRRRRVAGPAAALGGRRRRGDDGRCSP